MSIKVTCSSCSSDFNLNDSLEGKKVRCSKCKNIIEVIKKEEVKQEEIVEVNQEVEKIELDKSDKNNLTESLSEELIDESTDNDDFLEKSMDIGEEPKKAKLINKKLIIIFIIMLLLGAGIGYAYKTGLFNSKLVDKNVVLNSAKEIKKEISDINYMVDFSGSIESINSGESKSGSLNISGLKVYSNNKGLNQRISLGKVSLKVGKEELFSGSNLDIISDNEKVYLFLEKGFNQIVKTLGQNYTNTGTIDLLKSSFGTGKYVKIDNSKPLLTAFGKLSKNKLLKDVIIGLSTSNPKEYFSKNGIDTKLQEYFKSDKVLDYLFKEGKKDINSGKIPLTLNSNICSDYAPIVLNILDQVKSNPLLNLSSNYSNGNLIEECNKSLSQANKFLPMFIQMYKEGDTTLGNFKLSISSGNMLDVNMTYKNHILTTAYLSMQTPDKSIDFKAKLDDTSKVSSTLKLNYDKDGIILTGSVIDGSGMIDIIGKQQGVFDISGKITIKDYFLNTYDIKGNSGFMGMKSTITASGNLSKGAIYFLSKAGEKEIAKLDFSYNGNSYNLDFISDSLSIKSYYKNSVFNLDIKRKDYYSGEQSYNLSYNKGKIDGKISMNNQVVIIKGNYNNLKDFNINIFKENHKENNNFILKTQIISLSEIKYISSLKSDGKNIFEANVNVKKTKDKGYHVYDINGNMTNILSDILEGYSADARNSKRTQDLNNIAGSINIKSTMGVPLQSLVIRDEKYEGKNMYVGGVKLVGGVNYFAGTPNYVALGVRPEDFKDPSGEEYKIGVTTLKGGAFELLAFIENGDGPNSAKLNGTYNSNDALILKSGKDYEITGDNVIIIDSKYYYRIEKDYIIGSNKVLKVSLDGTEITFEKKFDKKIISINGDPKGLIFIDGKAMTNNYEFLNNKVKKFNNKKDGIYFNSKLKIKTGGVEYSIPKNYDEVDVNINERFILPDYTSAGRTKIDRKTLLIGGTTGLAIGGTISYISLQGYSADARNSKRIQDLNNIAGSINIKSTMGVPLQSLVIRDEKYEGKDMYVGGVKLVGGVNYFAGTPNYIALGVKPEDFKDPNGEEYIIGVTTLKGGSFELLTFIENGDGTNSAKIIGNYSSKKPKILKENKDYSISSTNSLFLINNKLINKINIGDIFYKNNKVLKTSFNGKILILENKVNTKAMFIRGDTKGLIFAKNKIIYSKYNK